LHTALAQMNDTLAATVADENARIAHLETAVFGRSSPPAAAPARKVN
jgi:hypothetical protein